jgi:hypothetical protein
MTTAFMSYSRRYEADFREEHTVFLDGVTRRVNENPSASPFTIWRDKYQLLVGKPWSPELEAAVRQADILLVILSGNWLQSPHCAKEFEVYLAAKGERARVVTVPFVDFEELKTAFSQHDIFKRIGELQLLDLTNPQSRTDNPVSDRTENGRRALTSALGNRAMLEMVLRRPADQLIATIGDLRRQSTVVGGKGNGYASAVEISRVGDRDFAFVKVEGGRHIVNAALGPQHVDVPAFKLSCNHVSLSQLSGALGRGGHDQATFKNLRAMIEELRQQGFPIRLASEVEWEFAVPRLAAAQVIEPPPLGVGEWVADAHHAQGRHCQSASAVEGATGRRVVMSLENGKPIRHGEREIVDAAKVGARLILET